MWLSNRDNKFISNIFSSCYKWDQFNQLFAGVDYITLKVKYVAVIVAAVLYIGELISMDIGLCQGIWYYTSISCHRSDIFCVTYRSHSSTPYIVKVSQLNSPSSRGVRDGRIDYSTVDKDHGENQEW